MREQRLTKLLEMNVENPEDTFVLYALGMEYAGLQEMDLAIGYFEKCLAVDVNHIPSLYQLGLLLSNLGQDEMALGFLNRGLQLLNGGKDLKTLNEFRSLHDEIAY